MNVYKLNAKFLFCFAALILALVLAGRVSYSWLTDQITVEGEKGSALLLDIVMPLALLITLSWLWSAVVMLRQYAVHGGQAFTLTEEGIEDTLTFVIIFALIFVLPVKRIPWSAVTYADGEEGYLRAKRGPIQAGFLAKTVVAFRGYQFCHSFIKPKLTREDFDTYVKPRLPQNIRQPEA